ncbi:MAG: ATP-binding protein [Bacteroidales bacterium]|nr:ATP-binding protein [Bacteroidales bacterium]
MKRTMKIASKIENLREVEKVVDEIATKFQLKNELYGNILIAFLEAVNNAIVHGNKQNEEKDVIVNITIEKGELHIVVKDQGKGFDYENVPDPTAPENIENISGRGIFLMRKLSDKLIFDENGTKAELIFYLDK